MDDSRASPARFTNAVAGSPRRWRRFASLTVLVLLAANVAAQTTPPPADAPLVEITAIRLRREGEQLNLHFLLSSPTPHEVVANLAKRVVVVKFAGARAAFPNDQREFAYNDPMLVGIAFEDIDGRDTWAKIRLRTPHLTYQVVAGAPPREMVLGLKPAPLAPAITLRGIRLGDHRGGSRLVLDLTGRPAIEERREGALYLVRLRGVTPQLTDPVQVEDARIAVVSVDMDGPDTLLRIRVKRKEMRVKSLVLPAPPRVVLDFRPAAPAVARAPLAPAARAAPPASREIPLDILLEREDNPLITANYLLAEREFRAGNFNRANLLFLRVFDSVPDSLLGVRAYFRAADSQYERNVVADAGNYHDVIITYQSAIRAAETIGYETELIASSLFRIGRAYQRMRFNFESNVHYQILQERFPDNFPYTPDSYHFQGLNLLRLRRYEEAVASFRRFLSSEGDPQLEGPAHYHLGDAYFNLKRFVDAKSGFDKGRRISPDYADDQPLLIFHMGETYYENAEFNVARVLYRTLLEGYPGKNYTKLVGLRLGDFLREEGKENEALEVYRQIIVNAPLEIRLRGKLRIANVLGSRPVGEDYKEAIALYDEIVSEGEGTMVLQEALLRKALTLTLHGQHQPAIDTLEKLVQDYPEGPFTRKNLTRDNIEENLKALVQRSFAGEQYWEVAKIYTRYRDRYFSRFRFPFTLFQAAKSYQQLGLYDEAIGLYDEILRRGSDSTTTLVELQKASAYLEKDDLGNAESTLLKFIQDHPQDVYLTDARMLLGKLYFAGRRYEDALNAYRILVREFERSRDPLLGEAITEAYFELGQIYKELGRYKEALDSFAAAVANFHHPIQGPSVPDFVELSQFFTADMRFELGQDREAIAAYEQAITLYGEHDRAPWARYQMGLIYRRLGDDQKALEAFNTLVELAKVRPGELWEPLAKENQRDLATKLDYQEYLKQ